MRRLFILFLILLPSFLSAQDYHFYLKNKKIPLKVSSKKILISFKENTTFESKLHTFIKSSTLIVNRDELEKSQKIVSTELYGNVSINELNELLININKNDHVEYANPYFTFNDSILLGLTNQFVVKLLSNSNYYQFEQLAKEANTVFKQDKYHENIYYLSTTKKSTRNALEIANLFFESGIFEFSEPNFVKTLELLTNDPYYSQQYSLHNTGQNGGGVDADMDVEEAWSITTGREEIKIAIIDGGVDLNHPDLVDNMLPGFDATGSGTNGGVITTNVQPAHGTHCAGIVAAKGNNGIGIAGVAYNCSLIPISLGFDSQFSDNETANAINWAWDNAQADVLSNSWRHSVPSSIIDIAINNAITLGRNGLGSVVLFAAGNSNNAVSWPASNPDVIAVGATTNSDIRTNFSCFGDDLDVVAPGENVFATDISGSGGMNSGDYYIFTGTSASCPNAAGVIALILSVNRCLTQANARRILELSCDKVGGYCYDPGKPHGLWNHEMGYGRVNAHKAVQYAYSLETNLFYNVGGADQGASSNYTWIVVSGGCSQLAAANYIVKRHEIRTIVLFPTTQAPVLVGSANGFSAANPSVANYFMDVVSLTSNSATLRTWVYEIIGAGGQTIGWKPTDPANIRFNFTILSSLLHDIYLQDEILVNGTDLHNAMNRIIVGKHVTSPPYGDYVVDDNATVVLHAGYEVELNPGTIIQPDIDGLFVAKSDPFFTCTQYPNGRTVYPSFESDVSTAINNFESIILNDNQPQTVKNNYIINYPNPFSNNTTIEFQISKPENVLISLTDNVGKQYILYKNTLSLEAGIYQFQYDGFNIPNGTYFLTFQTSSSVETRKIVKIK